MNSDFQVGTWLNTPSLKRISRKGTTVRVGSKVMPILACLGGTGANPLPRNILSPGVDKHPHEQQRVEVFHLEAV